MTQPYSKALREQIVKSVASGVSRRTTAQLFDVSLAFVVKLMQRWSREGTIEPKPQHVRALAPHAAAIRAMVAERPRITIDEIHGQLALDGIRVSRASVSRFLAAVGLTGARRRALVSAANRPPVDGQTALQNAGRAGAAGPI